ncbi:MAG: RNA recognition motif domain-containing protein [bacterium]
MNIYVGNLSPDVTNSDLQEAFEPFGQVTSANVIRDRYSSESRGFGFVEMSNKSEAIAAISGLNGTELKGKSISVSEARPRKSNRPGTGGGNRGRGGGWRR